MQHQRALLLLLAGLALAARANAMSIDKEPVKVTHSNSGPRYDFDEVERTKLGGEPTSAPARQRDETALEAAPEPAPIGHVAIRRILLVPMVAQERPDWQRHPVNEDASERQLASPFGRPLWPFVEPDARRPHLFGADEASRSPTDNQDEQPAASGERESDADERQRQPRLDPIQMMIELMQQALSGQLMPPMLATPPQGNPDLNREATGQDSSDSATRQDSNKELEAAERPTPPKPATRNETREDVVEIDGKKYLRKTIINRHIGENIIFMTKRLIFVPLNETDSTDTLTTTTTTTSVPNTESPSAKSNEVPSMPTSTQAPSDQSTTTAGNLEATTTTVASAPTSETTQTDKPTEAPLESTPAASASEQPEATTPAKDTTLIERVANAVNKAAERIVEESNQSSAKPATVA